MSRTSQKLEPSTTEQLKKELIHATTALQNVRSRIESIEAGLVASERASTTERTLKSRITDLEEALEELKKSNTQQQDAFAVSVTKLDLTFGRRLQQFKDESAKQLKEDSDRLAQTNQELRTRLSASEQKNETLSKAEQAATRQREDQKREKEALEKRLKSNHLTEVEEWKSRLDRSKEKLRSLSKDIDEHSTIIRGRDTEISRLQAKLSSFQKFSQLSSDGVKKILADLHVQFRTSCERFLDTADALPGWYQLPQELRSQQRPGIFSLEAEGSRDFAFAMVRHHLCRTVVEQVLIPVPFCACDTLNAVVDAICHTDPLHEAVWRLMIASNTLDHASATQMATQRSHAIGQDLIRAWKLHTQPQRQNEMEEELVQLLLRFWRGWLQIMTLREKTVVLRTGTSETFDFEGSNSNNEQVVGDDAQKMPGDFTADNNTAAGTHQSSSSLQLCTFPAFVQVAGSTEVVVSGKRVLLHKGTVLLPNSTVFVKARQEADRANAPKVGRRGTFSLSKA